jgi:8-oxo-dGTP pyrophosphatase MutT (NUDIX family)
MTDRMPAYPLKPSDAVGAILVTPDRRFLMQRRDDIPQIWYPGAWGLFGGGIDPGETEHQALRRELKEELDLELGAATFFTRFHFEFGFAGAPTVLRSYFEVPIEPGAVAGLSLREGREMGLIEADRVLNLPDVVGYDQFALYLYIHRDRVVPATPGPHPAL